MGCLYPFSSTAFTSLSFNFKSLKDMVLCVGTEAFSSSTCMVLDVVLMSSLDGCAETVFISTVSFYVSEKIDLC